MFSRFFFSAIVLVSCCIASIGASSAAGSQPETIRNWSAPAYWTPASAKTAGAIARPLGKQSDLTGALPFVPVTPCRIVDTRGAAGTFGGPSLPAAAPRDFPLPTGPCAGIPAGVSAYSLNITVTNTQGPGFISIYPQGGPAPLVSTLNYFAGQTLANAAIVPAGTSGAVTVVAGVSGTDLIIDINGYYAAALNSGEQLLVSANLSASGAIKGVNSSGNGVEGHTSGGASGVYGASDNGSGYGVAGRAGGGSGIPAPTHTGVLGDSDTGYGVLGESSGNDGVHGHTSAAGCCKSGVAGLGDGDNYGVYGSSDSGIGIFGTSFIGVGILGHEGGGSGVSAPTHTGVFGDSDSGYGVLGGSASNDGIHGNTAGNAAAGVSGINTGNGNGVYGSSTGGDGVHGHAIAGSFSGVEGVNDGGGNGVYGKSATGLGGNFNSTSGIALQASGSTYGILASANNSSPLNMQYNVGVFAANLANNFGPGVYGQSSHGPSVFGYRGGGHNPDPSNIVNGVHGVVGISDTPNGANPNAGVLGENQANGPGVYATSIGTGFVGSALIASNTVNGGTALYAYGISSSSAAAVITNDSSTTGGDIIQGWNQAAVKFKVRTDGEVYAHGAFHGNGIDYADRLPAERGLEPGDVVVIGHDGLLHRSTAPNATDVAGVYSTKPAMVGDREEDESRATIPIALAGVIPVKVMDGNGAIRAGDLLVSSSLPGYAMRAPRNPRPGTVIGKAMQKLDHGMGEIEMLVMLR